MLTAEETFFGVIGGIPGFGSVSGSLRGYGSGGIVASFAEAARNSWDQAQQGELDKAAVKSVLTVAGYATGIPAAQIKKTLDAIEAARRSEEHTSALQSLMRISYAGFCLKQKISTRKQHGRAQV